MASLAQRLGSDDTPAVLVDSFCNWKAYSDKIYFANRKGIDVIFPKTEDEHIRLLSYWTNRLPFLSKHIEPMQTEAFLKSLLDDSNAHVEKLDFNRTEIR